MSLNLVSHENVQNQLFEATKGNAWVVVKDNGKIWGSNASQESLKSAGGILWIFSSYDLKNFFANSGVYSYLNDIPGYSIHCNGREYTNLTNFLHLITTTINNSHHYQ